MQLINELYKIDQRSLSAEEATYHLLLNSGSKIYKAHFPGQPITPGACIVQIAVELLEDFTGSGLSMSEMKVAKFIQPIEPSKTSEITCNITIKEQLETLISATFVFRSEDTIFSKLSITCKKK